MHSFLIALIIGIVAGIIDVIPMLLMKLDKMASLSAFVHYLFLGLIIPFVDWGIAPWLSGIIIALLSAIPIMLIVYPSDKKAIFPIALFSVILGSGIGIVGNIFIP